jgi:hypothetical protein
MEVSVTKHIVVFLMNTTMYTATDNYTFLRRNSVTYDRVMKECINLTALS